MTDIVLSGGALGLLAITMIEVLVLKQRVDQLERDIKQEQEG